MFRNFLVVAFVLIGAAQMAKADFSIGNTQSMGFSTSTYNVSANASNLTGGGINADLTFSSNAYTVDFTSVGFVQFDKKSPTGTLIMSLVGENIKPTHATTPIGGSLYNNLGGVGVNEWSNLLTYDANDPGMGKGIAPAVATLTPDFWSLGDVGIGIGSAQLNGTISVSVGDKYDWQTGKPNGFYASVSVPVLLTGPNGVQTASALAAALPLDSNPVPEPASIGVFSLGSLVFLARRRRVV